MRLGGLQFIEQLLQPVSFLPELHDLAGIVSRLILDKGDRRYHRFQFCLADAQGGGMSDLHLQQGGRIHGKGGSNRHQGAGSGGAGNTHRLLLRPAGLQLSQAMAFHDTPRGIADRQGVGYRLSDFLL